MPVLTNNRHELFCGRIAAGISPADAYVSAGYAKGGAAQAASRLLKRVEICSRISELTEEASKSVLARAMIDRDWVMAELKCVISDKEHEPAAARVRALELCGKELGMFRDQSDHKFTFDGDLSKLTESQLQKLMLSLEARIADPVLLQQAREEAVKELDAGETVQ